MSTTLDIQAERLWGDTLAWLSSHSLQILGGVISAAVIVGVVLGLKWIGLRICRSDPQAASWRVVVGRVLAATRLWFVVALAARLVTRFADAPAALTAIVGVLFIIAATAQVALWARELTLGMIEHRAGGADASGNLGSAMGIIRLLVTATIFIIALVVVLDNLGVNVTGLIAGLGIGGIAIGLAAKGIFDDLFSALSIIFDKPFRRGDSIQWDKTAGTVEQIGLKSTRLRSVTGEEVVISNTNLLGKELHNLTRLRRRRIVEQFGVAYDTPAEKCAAIPGWVGEIVAAHDKCTLVRVGAARFATAAFVFEVQFDVAAKQWQDAFDKRSAVMLAIIDKLGAEGVAFANPI